MTAALPSAMASGTLRLGFRTSPEMMEMLCQESAEKREPDWATHKATIKPNTLAAATPSDGSYGPRANRCVKLARTALEFQPSRMPAAIKATRAAVFAVVNRF